MRRLWVIVLAGVSVLVLPGCALSTFGATSVTQTSARLNGYGYTGANTSYYHFEYARQRDQLGTAQGSRTPERGPIGPHVPADDTRIQFGETVTGLAPGHTYYDRVCGRPSTLPTDVCLSVDSFFTQPSSSQDYVIAGWEAGKETGAVKAASTASGGDPDGSLYDRSGGSGADFADFDGHVTCLTVHGDHATIGAVGTIQPYPFDAPPSPATELVTVTAQREWRTVARTAGTTPPDCSQGVFTGPSEAINGVDFAVHDAP
jgi:hypothetical protein